MVRPAPEVDQPTYQIVDTVERYDQRDHPNSRILLKSGTPEYEDYYSRHPEHKEWDDENRRIWANSLKHNVEKDPVNQQMRPATFYGRYVLGANSIVDGIAQSPTSPGGVPKRVDVNPAEMAVKIKGFGRHMGAADVRITQLKQEWVMSNYASPHSQEPYGKPVELDYENIICLTFPHDMEMEKCGVGVANSMESGWRYAYGSLPAVIIAHFIRSTGWRARALPPENAPYLVVPVFVDAGIGEQGRCSTVVTKEYGNNFKPSAVATDMPLALDKPVDFGVQDFCEKCHLCADYCPSGAITHGTQEVIRGVRRWPFDGDKCRRYWAKLGGNCSICIAVCPWSHSNNRLHGTVRELAQNFPKLRKTLIRGEKFIYGKYKPAQEPEWIALKGC
ncbi:4Fe-4S dicluster domain-containing protein [Chloroflexota bacterium]